MYIDLQLINLKTRMTTPIDSESLLNLKKDICKMKVEKNHKSTKTQHLKKKLH